MDTWEVVKDFYESKFGIDGWLVEMYANIDILSLCVSGASTDNIVKFLEISEDEVKSVLQDTFKFDGWKTDLPINPLLIYNSYKGDKKSDEHLASFTEDVRDVICSHPFMEYMTVQELYRMCKLYNQIEERIENEWI